MNYRVLRKDRDKSLLISHIYALSFSSTLKESTGSKLNVNRTFFNETSQLLEHYSGPHASNHRGKKTGDVRSDISLDN